MSKTTQRQLAMDFFVATLVDTTLRSDQVSMIHPLFSVSKKPKFDTVEWTKGNETAKLIPHQDHGRPTIFDRDILLFAMGQLAAAVNSGISIDKSKWIVLERGTLLEGIGKSDAGSNYSALLKALYRLDTTKLETNIYNKEEDKSVIKRKNFIDEMEITKNGVGRIAEIKIRLPDYMVDAVIEGAAILKIDNGYLDLKQGYARAFYMFARKRCGTAGWRYNGSIKAFFDDFIDITGNVREFRRWLKKDAEEIKIDGVDLLRGGVLDYRYKYDVQKDSIVVYKKHSGYIEEVVPSD